MNPIQRCIICNRRFWAGLPRIGFQSVPDFHGGKQLWFGFTFRPDFVEHCSRECADADLVASFGPAPYPCDAWSCIHLPDHHPDCPLSKK